jgi:hypothetical protein
MTGSDAPAQLSLAKIMARPRFFEMEDKSFAILRCPPH